MILSVRCLRACTFARLSSLSPLSSAPVTLTRTFLTDGANVIGSSPDKNSPDFKVFKFDENCTIIR